MVFSRNFISIFIYLVLAHYDRVPLSPVLRILLAVTAAVCLLAFYFFSRGYRNGMVFKAMRWLAHIPFLTKWSLRFLRRHGHTLHNIDREIAALDQAEVLLGRVDSLRETYMNDATHAFQFTQYTTAATRRGITERRDSMFVEWNKYAHDNYEDYEFLGDDTSRDIALDYVEKALILHPADVSLQYMKTDLTKE